jgi:hypothetical protein
MACATGLIATAAAVAGAGLSIFSTLWETTLQPEVPREVLSRVSAYDWFGSVAFVPFGYLIAAPLASLLGTRTMLLSAAAWAAGSLRHRPDHPRVNREPAGQETESASNPKS